LAIFWSNPLVGTITTLALMMLTWPAIAFALRNLIAMLGGGPIKAPRS
jgi:putative tricarboxylic transport membrane protein